MKEALALIAAVIAAIGNIPYLWDMVKGRVQPHPYTWFVWSIVSGIALAGQFAKGAGVGAWPTAVAEGFTILIFILSIRYGFKRILRQDTVFLVIALAGLIPWAVTKDPTISVVIVVGIDVVAFIPTLAKTWQYPATEKPLLYSMNVVRHVLTLFSLQAYNIATTLHSVAMIVTNAIMVSLIWRKNITRKKVNFLFR